MTQRTARKRRSDPRGRFSQRLDFDRLIFNVSRFVDPERETGTRRSRFMRQRQFGLKNTGAGVFHGDSRPKKCANDSRPFFRRGGFSSGCLLVALCVCFSATPDGPSFLVFYPPPSVWLDAKQTNETRSLYTAICAYV